MLPTMTDNWFLSHTFLLKDSPAIFDMTIDQQVKRFKKEWTAKEYPLPKKKLMFSVENGIDYRYRSVDISGIELLCVEVKFTDVHAVEFKLKFSDNNEILTIDQFLQEAGGFKHNCHILPNGVKKRTKT